MGDGLRTFGKFAVELLAPFAQPMAPNPNPRVLQLWGLGNRNGFQRWRKLQDLRLCLDVRQPGLPIILPVGIVGLFVMVGGLEARGVIGEVAELLGDVTGGSRTAEVLVILWGAAAGSALVDNIPFTAAMIPVVDELQAGQPFTETHWWALALGACFGGNATIIAAAANVAASGILERSGQPVSFARFLAIGVPVTLVSLMIANVYLLLVHV